MRILYASIFVANLLFAQSECKELEKELRRLEELQQIIEKKIAQNKELLRSIQAEKTELQTLKRQLQKEQKEINDQRYQKLAKDFASMDPEAAGDKFSKMDPKIAAYILYNMNSRKAGEALNYIDPVMVDKITKILIKLQKDANQSR